MKRSTKQYIAALESHIETLMGVIADTAVEAEMYKNALYEEWERQDMLNFLQYKKG